MKQKINNKKKENKILIYEWCKKKHPLINSQLVYEENLRKKIN